MYTFTKQERLSNKKLLSKLLVAGSSFLSYPFRVTWLAEPIATRAQPCAQILIIVSKRHFKKAVTRNLLKRRMREIYRLHKSRLLAPFLKEGTLLLGMHYIGKEIQSYTYMEQKMVVALDKVKTYYLER